MNSHHQMCLLGSEEAVVIERALRTAVLSVVEVINGINRNRLLHYQREVTVKEEENVQLRVELDKAEKELALLRQLVSFQQGQSGGESNASTSAQVLNSKLSVETSSCGENGIVNELQCSVEQSQSHCVDSRFECLGGETTAAVQDHFDLHTSPSEQHALVFSVSGCSENNTDLSSPVVKQEPASTDSVYIKFEVKEERMCTEQDGSCVFEEEPSEEPCFYHQKDVAFGTRSTPTYYSAQQTEDIRPSSVSRFKKRNNDRERQRRYRERIRSDPERLQAYLEKDRCRSKRKKPIHELPEQIQKEKRAMWREATRRSRARKKSHLAQWTEPL